MKTLIIGAGNIGTAIAYYLSRSTSDTISLLDSNENALNQYSSKINSIAQGTAIKLINQDVFSEKFFTKLINEYEVVISTLPWPSHARLCLIVKNFSILLIGISRPDEDYYRDLVRRNENINATIIHGCGLEPGLSELFTQYLTTQFSKIHEVFIACGGIPVKPTPPLDYKLVFGGENLPFALRKTLKIDHGSLSIVDRFGEVDGLYIKAAGLLECWNDGLTPWLAEYLIHKGVITCAQKTIRWPGYAKIVLFLHQAGFLSTDTIAMTKKLLLPKLQLEEDEIDMVILRICVKGFVQGEPHVSLLELIDYKDRRTSFTAMARTTGFSTALIAKFLWEKNKLFSNELMLTDCYSADLFDYLHCYLKDAGIKINIHLNREKTNVVSI